MSIFGQVDLVGQIGFDHLLVRRQVIKIVHPIYLMMCLQYCCMYHSLPPSMANSVEPDQMLHSVVPDLALHCLQMTFCSNTWGYHSKFMVQPKRSPD